MSEEHATEEKSYKLPVVPNKEIEAYKKTMNDELALAESCIIKTDEDRATLATVGKTARSRVKFFTALFERGIKAAKALHSDRCDERSEFTEPYGKIYDIAKDKIGTYDKEVADKKATEAAEKARKEAEAHSKRIAAARKKTARLLEGISDNTAKLQELETILETEPVSDEEAEVMRDQITLLQKAIANKQEKVEVAVTRVEEKAPIMSAPTSKAKPTGYEVTVTDPVKLAKAIADGIAPKGLVVKWNETLIKQNKKAGMEYPGVSYKPLYKKARL